MANPLISIDVSDGDTRPICEWQIVDSTGAAIDLTAGTKSVILYYRPVDSGSTSWTKTLTKSDAVNGKVQFAADVSHPFRPAGSPAGVAVCEGQLRYQDSAASPAVDVRIRDVLLVNAYEVFV